MAFLLFCLPAFDGSAATFPQAFLDKAAAGRVSSFPQAFLDKAAAGRVSMSYYFSAARGERQFSGSGTLVCQDNAYRLESEELMVCDDLAANWTVNSSSKEVVITASNAVDFFARPSEILTLLGLNSKKASVDVSVCADFTGALLSATLSDGMTIRVQLSHISFSPKSSLDDFHLDTSILGKGWMVTDLR